MESSGQRFEILRHERRYINAEPTNRFSKNSIDPKEKFLSMDRQEARKVLEVYVRRSLSMNDSSRISVNHVGEFTVLPSAVSKWRKKNVQRSSSDPPTQFLNITKKKSTTSNNKSSTADTAKSCEKRTPHVEEEVSEGEQNATGKNVSSKTSKKEKKSFLKTFFGFFSKKKDEQKKDEPVKQDKKKEANLEHVDSQAFIPTCLPSHKQSSNSSYKTISNHVKGIKKRPSLKKAFSFKRSTPEQGKGANSAEKTLHGTKPKKPDSLLLQGVHSRYNGEKHESYYEKVSEGFEQILKETEPKLNARGSYIEKEKTDGIPNSKEELIQQIISVLQKEGDRLDKTIKEDTTISNFFQDISYISFKKLADLYVEELETKVPQENREVVKFAFTLDLTAKVAGISNHTMNKIMGFGNRYLQDTFSQFSQNNRNESFEIPSDAIPSPD
ncbi:apoptosis facilitator Bcl-2-like protein 14 [Latimeria chalumnae]|uniref:apoptosis facilitator Bcl-2-like protein 14 n=1 Tax=Latimeria chalumnae TaxID=7897 RepID=UPI0003C124DB|nr:PREDICTED: apoptosis facilitator Bcl-2-like protein 14 [Latimeria chalumnae]|eukprot:XP_005987633.1 PREDICTED: apoptosis facilitator Bcl-2-like protein 14 [Latimeria chalumnae]